MNASKTRFVLGAALALALMGSGCARGSYPAMMRTSPADAAWLAGVWQGEMWETPASMLQGVRRLTVTFAADGSWTATTSDGRRGSGVVTVRDGCVVLQGELGAAESYVHYTLKQRDHRQMWGAVLTTFGSRTAGGIVDFKRVN
jgi:hypothetical protein